MSTCPPADSSTAESIKDVVGKTSLCPVYIEDTDDSDYEDSGDEEDVILTQEQIQDECEGKQDETDILPVELERSQDTEMVNQENQLSKDYILPVQSQTNE